MIIQYSGMRPGAYYTVERMVGMGKLEEVLEMMKLNDLLGKKEDGKDNGNTLLSTLR